MEQAYCPELRYKCFCVGCTAHSAFPAKYHLYMKVPLSLNVLPTKINTFTVYHNLVAKYKGDMCIKSIITSVLESH